MQTVQYSISPFGDELAYSTQPLTDSSMAWNASCRIFTVKIEVPKAAATTPTSGSGSSAGSTPHARPGAVLALSAGAVTNVSALHATVGNDHSPSYSPDGKYLLYLSMVGDGAPHHIHCAA